MPRSTSSTTSRRRCGRRSSICVDVDYLIDHGEVKIVDEFTGRALEGRRYSEGLHQAIEAKEGVAIKDENQTLATITLRTTSALRGLAGMTAPPRPRRPSWPRSTHSRSSRSRPTSRWRGGRG